MTTNKLTPRTVASLKEPGRYSDGDRLYLAISKTAAGTISKRWSFMFKFGGKQREAGFGSANQVSLAEARKEAAKARDLLAKRIDPLAAKWAAIEADKAAAAAKEARRTFGEVALDLIKSKHKSWRPNDFERHAALIWQKPVDSIDVADVLAVLKSLSATPDTASRVRGRIENVLDAAKVRGLRQGENPAAWRGNLAHLLPKRPKANNHHAAMPYEAIPAFVAGLRKIESVAAMALEFTILTAVRTGEARFARWSEIDMEAHIWVIPASRMKAGQEHRVPLARRAIELLEELAENRHNDWIFPGRLRNAPIGENAMFHLMPHGMTVHGFRSSFRDFAGNETNAAHEVCEQALAHTIGGVEAAYRRGDALAKRAALMEAWARHCVPTGADANVVPLRA
jgi:integrase